MTEQTEVQTDKSLLSEKQQAKHAPSSSKPKLFLFLLITAACCATGYYVFYGKARDVVADEETGETEQTVVITEAPPEETKETKIPSTSITASISQEVIDTAEHPLDPLLEMAKRGFEIVSNNVQDYEAVMTKRVRWKGKMQQEYKLLCKIRHAQCDEDPEKSVPFSVYSRFISPKKGQEAIWVEGCNDEKLIAHGPVGFMNLMTVHLEPTSSMAMSGNRYPVQQIGMLNLIKLMIEKGTHDRNYGDCKVILTRNVMVDDARCTRLEIIHEKQAEHFEFHRAEIYIDDDRNLPIAYRSYIWPDAPGGRPKMLERYYYTDIKINVGLTDSDFDPANESYDFPGQ